MAFAAVLHVVGRVRPYDLLAGIVDGELVFLKAA
jgi:hypothetical protein